MNDYEAAAKALLAKVQERGGVENVGHLDAHSVIRQALGNKITSPYSWKATTAAMNALYQGHTSADFVANAIRAGHEDESSDGVYPAALYGTGDANKPSQWVTPERREALLKQSSLGRTVTGGHNRG